MGSHSTLSPACPTRPPTGKRVADPAYPARDFGGRDMEGQTPQGGNMADEAAAFEAQAAAVRDRFGADFAHPLNGNEFGELSDWAKLAATPNAEAGDNLPAVVAAPHPELADLVGQETHHPTPTP